MAKFSKHWQLINNVTQLVDEDVISPMFDFIFDSVDNVRTNLMLLIDKNVIALCFEIFFL